MVPPNAEWTLSLPLGTYGVMLIDDEDNDNKLDTNWLGMPSEGIGASRGAAGGPFGGPPWGDAKFEFAKCDVVTTVSINLWWS